MAERAPAFQFYPKDFLTDEHVCQMSHTERGIYITLLSLCWLEGTLPLETDRLAKMVHVSLNQFTRLWEKSVLRQCFQVHDDGRLHHKRLDEEREKQANFKRRQSDNGKRGGRPQGPTKGLGFSGLTQTEAKKSSSSPISNLHTPVKREEASVSPDPFVNASTTDRAAKFLERYQLLYRTHRKGARYALKPVRDYAAAVTLCATWTDDDRLDKLAIIFLTTDHKFAEEGSRTVPQFLALASWADGKLAEWEARNGSAA